MCRTFLEAQATCCRAGGAAQIAEVGIDHGELRGIELQAFADAVENDEARLMRPDVEVAAIDIRD
jgi:hypothetical protein